MTSKSPSTQAGEYVREEIDDLDVFMFQVAPMDKHGFFNFGPECSHSKALSQRAKVVIVEVNEKMPTCLGGYEESVHISEVDFIVEGENPILTQLPSPPPTALVANLDLVISVDSAAAHLAAALGRPVWLLDRFDADWRWLIGRRDSPWYPTLRLYRQPAPGDWDSVIAEVVRDLRSGDGFVPGAIAAMPADDSPERSGP